VTSRVLIVEDNADLAEGIADNLRCEGHDTRIAEDGRDGLTMSLNWPADLVILDLMLPTMNGYQVLRGLRSAGAHIPVIILTARVEEADKVRGFRLDADQYVTKPFGILELIERVAALLRRSNGTATDPVIRFGTIVVHPDARTVLRGDEEVMLSPKAFTLLVALHRRRGAVATRQELLREVWGYGESVMSRTVDSHIMELRRKLEADPADPSHILTVWAVGYRLAS
jgi:two-component system, OmpR family, alkaline phosphatase synthesis response regulator PhoP